MVPEHSEAELAYHGFWEALEGILLANMVGVQKIMIIQGKSGSIN